MTRDWHLELSGSYAVNIQDYLDNTVVHYVNHVLGFLLNAPAGHVLFATEIALITHN